MGKSVKYYCDIKDCDEESGETYFDAPLLFTTEQNEGRATKPYPDHSTKFYLCRNHRDRFWKQYPLLAEGAMGHNDIRFRTQ